MAGEPNQSGAATSAAHSIIPPYLVLRDFLAEETVAGLLDFAVVHEAAFAPTMIGPPETRKLNPYFRISVGMHDLGRFRPVLKAKMLGLVPELVAKLRTPPLESPQIEIELVAHNDGAFYKNHIDTQTAADRHDIRVLSGVYYFHAEPKAFGGGALRLYAIGDPQYNSFVDIEPEHNSLLVFPSWAPHEVMPISCPSRRFINSRFAINCWVRRRKKEAAATGP